MLVFIPPKHIREGDRIYYLGALRTIQKVTPRFHSVELHFDDVGSWQIGDQDWTHVERDES